MGKIIREKNSLSWRTSIYLLGKILLQGIGVVSNYILVRIMSTDDFGIVSIFTAWTSFFIIIVGLRVEGTINNAKKEFGEQNLERYCSSVITLAIASCTVLLLTLYFVYDWIKVYLSIPRWMVLLAALYGFGNFCISMRTIYYAALKKPIDNVKISAVNSISVLVLSMIFIILSENNKSYGRIWGLTLPQMIMAIFIVYSVWKRGKVFFEKKYWCFALHMSLPLLASGLSSVILSHSDTLMIGNMINVSEAGIYSFAYTIALPIYVILNAFAEGWTPEYYEMMHDGKFEELEAHMKKYRRTFLCITIGYMFISPEVLRILGTKEYQRASSVVIMLIILYALYFLQSWPVNYLFYRAHTKLIATGFVLSAITNIILNSILIPRYSIEGAALATVLSSLILFIFHDVNARYIVKNFHIKPSFYVPLFIGYISAGIVVNLTIDFILIRWAVGMIVGLYLIYIIITEKEFI